MKHQTFEGYLQGVFFQEFHGTKDQFEDAFDRWLGDREVDEMLQHGEDYGKALTF